MTDPVDDTLKAQDPDRWLSSCFIDDPAARADISAIYLLDNELAAVASKAANPLMGEIRFAWWREGLEAIRDGSALRSHPALEALAPANSRGLIKIDPLLNALDARYVELDSTWFTDELALDDYLDKLAGVTVAAFVRLDPTGDAGQVTAAGRLIAFSQLLRRGGSTRRPSWTPEAWSQATDAEVAAHLRHKFDELATAARAAPLLSAAAFPAVAHATLALHPSAGPLARRLRLTWAVLRGRI